MDCWRKLKPWPDVWMVWTNGFGHVPVGSGSWSSFIGTTGASPKTTVSRYGLQISGDPEIQRFFAKYESFLYII